MKSYIITALILCTAMFVSCNENATDNNNEEATEQVQSEGNTEEAKKPCGNENCVCEEGTCKEGEPCSCGACSGKKKACCEDDEECKDKKEHCKDKEKCSEECKDKKECNKDGEKCDHHKDEVEETEN